MSTESVGSEKPPRTEPVPDANQVLLGRFSAVWVWTVFFGLNAALSASFLSLFFNFLNTQFLGRGNPSMYGQPTGGFGVMEFLAFALPVFSVGGFVASIASWGYLYVYFSSYILPNVMLLEDSRREDRRRKVAARSIRRVYLLTIVAGILRCLPELVMNLQPLLARFANWSFAGY